MRVVNVLPPFVSVGIRFPSPHPAGPGPHRRDPPLLAAGAGSQTVLRLHPLQRIKPPIAPAPTPAHRISTRRSGSVMLPSTNVIPGWCSIYTCLPVARLSMITASRSHGKGAIGVSSIQNLRAFNAEWRSGKQGLTEIESAPGGKESPQIGRMRGTRVLFP